jgi:hypothetical protein
VSIFQDKKTNLPTGFALGSIEGRVAIQYVNTTNPKDNFTFKCHRSNGTSNNVQDIYAVSWVLLSELWLLYSSCMFLYTDALYFQRYDTFGTINFGKMLYTFKGMILLVQLNFT